MEFKKVNIFDTFGKTIYSDQCGPMNNDNVSISILDNTSNQWYDDNSLFIKTGKTYERLRDKYQSIDITKIFGRKLYIISHNYRNAYRYRYGYNSVSIPQNDEQAEGINFSKIKVDFRNWSIEIDKSNKQAFDIDVWVADNNNWELRRVKYHQLRQCDLVYYSDLRCTCEVYKILEPNSEGNVCIIKSLKDGAVYTISSDKTLYWVPYIEHEDELAIFNEQVNELKLAPYVLEKDNLRNIFWQPIEDASQYTVSVYKLFVDRYNDCKNRLYHLADYVVERNTCFLTLKDLIGEDYIIRVFAENRNGEIIAESRGIRDSGTPQFWKE